MLIGLVCRVNTNVLIDDRIIFINIASPLPSNQRLGFHAQAHQLLPTVDDLRNQLATIGQTNA
jgi:hypothetical protein